MINGPPEPPWALRLLTEICAVCGSVAVWEKSSPVVTRYYGTSAPDYVTYAAVDCVWVHGDDVHNIGAWCSAGLRALCLGVTKECA